jgi:hypothetical protein
MDAGSKPTGPRKDLLDSGRSEARVTMLAGRGLQAAGAVCLLAWCNTVIAQQAVPPSPGQILRDIERTLPSRPMSAPEGGNIEVPEAPAATPESLQQRLTVRAYHITGNSVFDEKTLLELIAGRSRHR